jgi:MerR family transcriptional regulator, light-induced transcriptional regulator
MYTISQAAARSGVGVALLRAWERRYGVVSPGRTQSGYRLYDDTAIARLRAMRVLVDSGWAAAQAAEAVIAGSVERSGEAPDRVAALAGDNGALVRAAAAYDAVGIESAIDLILARGSFEAVVDDHLLPAVAALGTAWADGVIDVAAEHLASAAIQRRLAALFDLAGRPGSGRPVVVGLPPGSRHEIGTLAFAVALRRRGVEVLYLGPDTPVASWIHVVGESRARAAVIGVPQVSDAGAAIEVASALRAAGARPMVAIGGPGAEAAATVPAGRTSVETATGVEQLPDRVTDAATTLARRLDAG